MSKPTLLIVVPVYGHFDYAASAVSSALQSSQAFKTTVAVIDDASPEAVDISHPLQHQFAQYAKTVRHFQETHDPTSIVQMRFDEGGGLTRSWNAGLTYARDHGFDYCCVTNSDVIFAPGWDVEILEGLKKFALVGPVTNTPGDSKHQQVSRYSKKYSKTWADSFGHIADVQMDLTRLRGKYFECHLNGFCTVAKTSTWWNHSFDATHVFRPRNDFHVNGQKNNDPLNAGNEDELQRRWQAKHLKRAACLGSYVFHYRAVTRGKNHLKGDWARKKEAPK